MTDLPQELHYAELDSFNKAPVRETAPAPPEQPVSGWVVCSLTKEVGINLECHWGGGGKSVTRRHRDASMIVKHLVGMEGICVHGNTNSLTITVIGKLYGNTCI